MKKHILVGIIGGVFLLSGCIERIPTGTVGVRIGFDKQVKVGELLPGSFNQTLVGDIITFPIKDVNVVLENLTPVAKDNSTMKDLDAVVVYNIAPDKVSELYSTKNRSFHANQDGDTYLMYNYVIQNTRNAIYKAARQYEALDMADNRDNMESFIKDEITRNLAEEKLNGVVTISQVMIRNVQPADSVVASANELVRSKNELKQKEIEVKTAEAEARRQQVLAQNGPQTIEYMKAQATLTVANAIAAGKVNTIIIPSNLTMLGNVGK